jgi:Uma2 family endonuclease
LSTVVLDPPEAPTLDELLEKLGSVPTHRIRTVPAIGTASEEDVRKIREREGRICELVDGVLVEKAVGYYESLLATVLIQLLWNHIEPRKLGVVSGPDGFLRLRPRLVRAPDVAFVSTEHLPRQRLRGVFAPDLAPDFAVEILSASNTEAEMQLKLREYFAAGCRLAWLVDPETKTVRVYTAVGVFTTVGPDGTLDGGEVLPGFSLSIEEWFSRVPE